ncbi:MAG TPA: YdcF family protein [Terriglobales bacterium]|nr:YdcF family protein [Terriglobales bacterium]
MKLSIANWPPRRNWTLWTLAGVALFFVLFLVVTSLRIVREAGKQELHPAAAIVVFGAAEYSGHPSPVLRARLDHAYDLYAQHLAPVIITTGGAGDDPSYSEGGVGRDYLMHRGVPERNLIAETLGTDTAHSAERLGVILRANGMQTCLAVSDEYHVFRIKRLLQHEGVQVYVSPRTGSRPKGVLPRMMAVLREAVSFLVWKFGLPV